MTSFVLVISIISGLASLILFFVLKRYVRFNRIKKEYLKYLAEVLDLDYTFKNSIQGSINGFNITIHLKIKTHNVTGLLVKQYNIISNTYGLRKRLRDYELVINIEPGKYSKLPFITIMSSNRYTSNNSTATGDLLFDKHVSVSAPDAGTIFVSLTRHIRQQLLSIVNKSFYFSLDEYSTRIACLPIDVFEVKSEIIDESIDVLQSLIDPGETTDRLLHLIQSDDIQQVKQNQMRALLNLSDDFTPVYCPPEFDNDQREMITGLTKDQDVIIVAMAYYALGEKHISDLLKLLDKSDNSQDETMVLLNLLRPFYKLKTVQKGLHNKVADVNCDEFAKIISIFKQYRDTESFPDVMRFLQKHSITSLSTSVIDEVLNYFMEMKKPEAIPIIAKLKNMPDNMKLLIIKTYSEIGHVNAVEYLLSLKKIGNSIQVKNTAQVAINTLQQNIPEGDRGNLTIEDELQSGMLSNPDDEMEGGLSMEDNDL